MRILFSLSILVLCCLQTSLFAQSPSFRIADSYTKDEVYIPMRDGKRLYTAIYTPKDTSKRYPVMMVRTPYSIAPYGKDKFPERRIYIPFFQEGYIMVFQDVRGKYMSEGEFMNIRPFKKEKKSPTDTDENTDTYDTIDWLVKNAAHNNGRVGIMGISYPGFYATMSLPNAHPALKAVSPQAPVTEWFIGDDIHHNGAFFTLDNFGFSYSFDRPRKKPTTENDKAYEFGYENMQDNYDFFMNVGPLINLEKRYMKGEVPYWKELMEHPNYDSYWKERNPCQYLKDIQPAVMVTGGWFDAEDLYGTLHTYQALEKQNVASHSNHLVMGPWSHGQWERDGGEHVGNVHFGSQTSRYYQDSIEMPFFNYYLKDKGTLNMAKATVFITGSNRWRTFNSWPPANTTPVTYYFQPDGFLSTFKPGAVKTNRYDEYISDPAKPVPYTEDVHLDRTKAYMSDDQRFASRRPDVLVYQTDDLSEDITVAGPVQTSLFVSTSGTDADFVVKLIDVFPDTTSTPASDCPSVPMGGYEMLVRGDIMRGRYRESYETPKAFTPDKVTEVKLELQDIAHTFKKGHRIMVQVQSSWFPLVDRNPQQFVDIYHAKESDFIKATHRIYRMASYPSGIVLPRLK